ncbi:MAG: arginine--tRNA ligase [Pseudomonadota bacterium]
MNLFAEIQTAVLQALDTLVADGDLPEGLSFDAVAVEPPRDAAHGDMATNAAMVLAKPAGAKPRDIATPLADRLMRDPRIATATVAGPGFLNLRLTPGIWHAVLPAALRAGQSFGRSDIGAAAKINVEYVSANPTGPLHVGHTRGAVFGDALASLLDFVGFDVTREYYINDGGGQVDTLARSVYLRYLEAHGQMVEFPEGTYPGDYLAPVGQALKASVGDAFVDMGEQGWLSEVRDFATQAMVELIQQDLEALGVQMDLFSSEKALYTSGGIEAALARLDDLGLIYEGTLDPPKGKLPEDWEARPQTLFRSTVFGDDVDRPVKKSDGSWTYFAPDIAYHFDKISRGYVQLIDVFGADHGGYVKRMKAAVQALSEGRVPLDIKLTQLVRLYKDGVPYKMSKRAGTFVTLRDVVDQVGPDVTRFVMLTRKNDAPLDFDFSKALEESKDNPVFYVQYAHARIASALRRGEQTGVSVADTDLAAASVDSLTAAAELGIIRKLAEWPRLVEAAAQAHEPHRVAFYLYDLASAYHALQHQGKIDPELRFVQADSPEQTQARLAMIRSVQVVLANGLGILGVTPAEDM